MINFVNLSELSGSLRKQYRSEMSLSYPKFLYQSEIVKTYWSRLEKTFPNFQLFMIEGETELLGYINAIPFYWDQPLDQLPKEGWDWLIQKGISDQENQIEPNNLGGLQIGVSKKHQGKGLSKMLISEGKRMMNHLKLKNFIIPIRPIYKSLHPEMKMEDYIHLKKNDKIYDPWIRTHLNCGAEIINVCSNAMYVSGNIEFWEKYIQETIISSGNYYIKKALNPINIQVEKNQGEYCEENVWIYYSNTSLRPKV